MSTRLILRHKKVWYENRTKHLLFAVAFGFIPSNRYTLELVNRRDTLASVLGMGCEQ